MFTARKWSRRSDAVAFFAYVSFFPQLVAGPIERASNLLPQFLQKRSFNYDQAADGMRQILWGFFKKVVIADNCAPFVNDIFANPDQYSGSMLLLGAVLFAFQIYGDFSGYSDIAIGTARLFGFRLMRNFAYPYFSRDIAEFWRRWHISLSTWFRDYLYIPLGGSHGSNWMRIRNIFAIFLVSGFWHGANWTFIVWGGINALYFLPLMLLKRNRRNLNEVAEGRYLPSAREFVSITITFFLTVIAWIFFRADSVTDAWHYLLGIFHTSLFQLPDLTRHLGITGLLIIGMLLLEWIHRDKQHALEIAHYRSGIRWSIYLVVFLVIFIFGTFQENAFIYFQF